MCNNDAIIGQEGADKMFGDEGNDRIFHVFLETTISDCFRVIISCGPGIDEAFINTSILFSPSSHIFWFCHDHNMHTDKVALLTFSKPLLALKGMGTRFEKYKTT
jgi:hypothetical protein